MCGMYKYELQGIIGPAMEMPHQTGGQDYALLFQFGFWL